MEIAATINTGCDALGHRYVDKEGDERNDPDPRLGSWFLHNLPWVVVSSQPASVGREKFGHFSDIIDRHHR